MNEQSGPKELVRHAVSAEHAGFDFEVCSDHYSPWLASQGHAPHAWTTLGADATDHVELLTYVTCPNADLPTTAGFAGATQFVRPEDTAEAIPCGPDLDAIVDAVGEYWNAGFTDITLMQVGDGAQDEFLKEAAAPLLEKLRDASS